MSHKVLVLVAIIEESELDVSILKLFIDIPVSHCQGKVLVIKFIVQIQFKFD